MNTIWMPKNTTRTNGPDGGIIILDEELEGQARITVEIKNNDQTKKDYYSITVGIYGLLVHTGYFNNKDDVMETTEILKLVIQVLISNQS